MITLHHLDNSRSLRILWLLEELELPYDLVEHKRDAVTRLAPASPEAVHPLGKAPLLVDSADYNACQMWLHYVEGSAMLPIMLNLYATLLGGESPALRARTDSELARHLGSSSRRLPVESSSSVTA